MGCILKINSFYNSTLFSIISNQQGSSVTRTRKGKCAAVDSEGIIVPKWNDMKDVPGIIVYHDIKLVPHKTWVVTTLKTWPGCDYNVAIGGRT
jgi:hypothetical protein